MGSNEQGEKLAKLRGSSKFMNLDKPLLIKDCAPFFRGLHKEKDLMVAKGTLKFFCRPKDYGIIELEKGYVVWDTASKSYERVEHVEVFVSGKITHLCADDTASLFAGRQCDVIYKPTDASDTRLQKPEAVVVRWREQPPIHCDFTFEKAIDAIDTDDLDSLLGLARKASVQAPFWSRDKHEEFFTVHFYGAVQDVWRKRGCKPEHAEVCCSFFERVLENSYSLSKVQKQTIRGYLSACDPTGKLGTADAVAADIDYKKIAAARTNRIILVVDQVRDIGNLHSIYRTAEGLGVQHVWVILPKSFNGRHVQKGLTASRGAAAYLTIREFKSVECCCAAMQQSGRKIWATALDDRALALDMNSDLQTPLEGMYLVVGSEGTGVADDILAIADKKVMLPMVGVVESLNVTVATALALQVILTVDRRERGDNSLPVPEQDILIETWTRNARKKKPQQSSN